MYISIGPFTPTTLAFVLACAWSLVLPPGVVAAPVIEASLNGTVRDVAGVTVPGAHLVLRNATTGVGHRSASNPVGDYTFEEIPAGLYPEFLIPFKFTHDFI